MRGFYKGFGTDLPGEDLDKIKKLIEEHEPKSLLEVSRKGCKGLVAFLADTAQDRDIPVYISTKEDPKPEDRERYDIASHVWKNNSKIRWKSMPDVAKTEKICILFNGLKLNEYIHYLRPLQEGSICILLDSKAEGLDNLGYELVESDLSNAQVWRRGPKVEKVTALYDRTPRPAKELRISLLGHLTYPSGLNFGLVNAAPRLGHYIMPVDINLPAGYIHKALNSLQPHIIICHMAMWPPDTAQITVEEILKMLSEWRALGTKVLIQDGDPRGRQRYPYDVSKCFDLALVNRDPSPSEWNIHQLKFHYAAIPQKERIKTPNPTFQCDVGFVGYTSKSGIYEERTKLIELIEAKPAGLVMKQFPKHSGGVNTLYLVPEMAASAGCLIGWGRPECQGWVDARVYETAGAGGIIIHDDVQGVIPEGLYLPCTRGDYDSTMAAALWVKTHPQEVETMRDKVFHYMQEHHSWENRLSHLVDYLYE